MIFKFSHNCKIINLFKNNKIFKKMKLYLLAKNKEITINS